PGYAAGFAETAAAPAERIAHLGDRTVPVVGEHFNEESGAAGPIALIGDLLEGCTLAAADRPFYRTVDGVDRHVCHSRAVHDEPTDMGPDRHARSLVRLHVEASDAGDQLREKPEPDQ